MFLQLMMTILILFELQKINEVGKVPFESTTTGTEPGKAAITALTGVENPHFPVIQDWIKGFLQDKSEVSIVTM